MPNVMPALGTPEFHATASLCILGNGKHSRPFSDLALFNKETHPLRLDWYGGAARLSPYFGAPPIMLISELLSAAC